MLTDIQCHTFIIGTGGGGENKIGELTERRISCSTRTLAIPSHFFRSLLPKIIQLNI